MLKRCIEGVFLLVFDPPLGKAIPMPAHAHQEYIIEYYNILLCTPIRTIRMAEPPKYILHSLIVAVT